MMTITTEETLQQTRVASFRHTLKSPQWPPTWQGLEVALSEQLNKQTQCLQWAIVEAFPTEHKVVIEGSFVGLVVSGKISP